MLTTFCERVLPRTPSTLRISLIPDPKHVFDGAFELQVPPFGNRSGTVEDLDVRG
jgi:hypothetical protein